MFEDNSTACFDPTSMAESGGADDGFSQTVSHNSGFEENLRISMEELTFHHHQNPPPLEADSATAIEIELQQQLGFNMENLNQAVLSFAHHDHEIQQLHQQQVELQNGHHLFNSSSSLPTPDLLNLFNSSLSFPNSGYLGDFPAPDAAASGSPVLYDPLFHLNLPPQPPLFRELFHSLPDGYTFSAARDSLFGGGENDHHGDENPGVLEFTSNMANCMVRRRNGKLTKHFATERQRRVNLNDKYQDLKSLVPSPSKNDRASIVGDAIAYIKELLRTVNELKILVEKKRGSRERNKRRKMEDGGGDGVGGSGEIESSDMNQCYNGSSSLRSSWLQRKSKETEVDVRIIDDEVTIKLVQRKKINCLLFVSKVLDELHLDLHHLAGGLVGDYNSFLFNTKIYEGSSVYASAIASKLIEVMDRQYVCSNSTF